MAAIPIPGTEVKNGNVEEVSCSPALHPDAYATLGQDETNGVPLDTHWTFWIDKWVIQGGLAWPGLSLVLCGKFGKQLPIENDLIDLISLGR